MIGLDVEKKGFRPGWIFSLITLFELVVVKARFVRIDDAFPVSIEGSSLVKIKVRDVLGTQRRKCQDSYAGQGHQANIADASVQVHIERLRDEKQRAEVSGWLEGGGIIFINTSELGGSLLSLSIGDPRPSSSPLSGEMFHPFLHYRMLPMLGQIHHSALVRYFR